MEVVVNSLCYSYGKMRVLNDVSFSLSPGITGLLGSNGAGKTTLIRLLATITHAARGEYWVDGVPISSLRSIRALRRTLGYLPQHFDIDPHFSCLDALEYCSWLRGHKSSRSELLSLLEEVNLESQARTQTKKLSGGMHQRLGLACALVANPQLIVLDEPTVGLDPAQRLEFRNIIHRRKEATILLSTHLVEDVAAICERSIILRQGEVIFHGNTMDILAAAEEGAPGNSAMERGYMSILAQENS